MYNNIKQINKKELKDGSLLKQYFLFKEKNLDSILLFQIGGFFETLFQDAKLFSEITGVSLGSRTFKSFGEVLQAGVPIASVDFYIKKLLNEDLKVCLCIQSDKDDKSDENGENAEKSEIQTTGARKNKEEKKCLPRKLIRKYTKGTIIENEFLDSSENNYILAVFAADDLFYLAYSDVSTGQFYKTKGNFESIIHEIKKIAPNELLISDTQKGIFIDLSNEFNTTYLKEKKFKDGVDSVILKYCKYTQKDFLPKFDKIIEYNIDSYLAMDEITRRSLELTRTRRLLKKKGSILWFLNYTKTPMGTRLLKKYLNEPLLNLNEILKRQQAVEELIVNEKLVSKFEQVLENFCDLSRMCAKISNSTIYPKDLFQLVKNSKSLDDLYKLCEQLKSDLLKVDKTKLTKTLQLSNIIKNALSEESSNEIKSGGVINNGFNSELDYYRDLLDKVYKNIDKYQAYEKRRLSIEKLKISQSTALGYYIEIPHLKRHSIPNDYFRKQELTNCIRYTTEKLKKMEDEICSLTFKINHLEYELYCEVRKIASKFTETIRSLAKDIARIDVLVSYSKCAIVNRLTKPKFIQEGIFIKDGFHPSLIKLKNDIVPNDTILNDGTMIVLTGANMSGKSTYLKYNAIICLLSQIGSYIPANAADLPIVDKLFIRQGSTDDIINNNSSFMVEMNDLKFILDNATNSSFVLLDEPAKSTNAKEGGAIARAFCEYLLDNFKAKIIIATHNTELTKLEQNYPNRVYNYVIGNANEVLSSINDRKVKRGVISTSLAINTAILANLPREIIKRAKKYIAKN